MAFKLVLAFEKLENYLKFAKDLVQAGDQRAVKALAWVLLVGLMVSQQESQVNKTMVLCTTVHQLVIQEVRLRFAQRVSLELCSAIYSTLLVDSCIFRTPSAICFLFPCKTLLRLSAILSDLCSPSKVPIL